jgi:hypothetical protein
MPTIRKFVFISLCEQANDHGECYPSISSISKRCCVDKRTVYRCLNELETGGYLIREKHPTRRSNLYTVTDFNIWGKGDTQSSVTQCHGDRESPQGDTESLSMVTHSHPNGDTVSPPSIYKEPSYNRHIEPSCNHQRARARRTPLSLGAPCLPDWLPTDAWTEWIRYRKSGKTKFTEKAEQLCIKELGLLREQGNDPVAVIEQSIMNGWKGLFPIHGRSRDGPSVRNGFPSQAARDAENARAKAMLFGSKPEIIDV